MHGALRCRAAFLMVASFVSFFAISRVGRAQAARVSITINSVTNFRCVDQKFGICGAADMLVRVALRDADGNQQSCADSKPVANANAIGPLTPCSSLLVTTPADAIVSVFDVDDSQLPTVSIEGPLRVGNDTQGGIATVPWFQLNAPVTLKGADVTVVLTPTVTLIKPKFFKSSLTLSVATIDPAIGDRTLMSDSFITLESKPVSYPGGVPTRFSVRAPDGSTTELATLSARGTGFNVDWDGRLNGRAVPPGTYTLVAQIVETGEAASATVEVKGAPRVFAVSRKANTPWNPRAGDMGFDYRLNPGGKITYRVEGPAPNGAACAMGPLPLAVPDKVGPLLNAGSSIIDVQTTTAAGAFLAPGSYCVHFSAQDASGVAIDKPAQQEMNIVAAPPLQLVVGMNPAIPWLFPATTATDASGTAQAVPSVPVSIVAQAFDDNGNVRPTGQITVRAIPWLTSGLTDSTLISTVTCRAASTCTLPISTRTLTTSTMVVFDAQATDLAGPGSVPPAMSTLQPRGAALVWAFTKSAGPISAPVVGSVATGFGISSRRRTQDVAIHAGTGLDISVPAQATMLDDVVQKTIGLFFGGAATVGPTSVSGDGGRSLALWFTRDPAVITQGSAGSGAPTSPLCERAQVTPVPFADMQAVIHTVNCRDNSDWNGATFSVSGVLASLVPFRMWHEFHHAAYGLADEYPPDGGYFETSELPNVMSGASHCAGFGAEPDKCAQIGTTGWWRAAGTPDVMIDNTRENRDELRRAKLIQDLCTTNGC